jgi:methionyl-tRNA synthetase
MKELLSANTLLEVDEVTLTELKAYPAVISSSIERYRFREALGELMNVARLGNKYFAMKSLENDKTDAGRVQTANVMWQFQIVAALSSMRTVLAFTAAKLSKY